MAWDFETDPDFQTELDWIDRFVREEVEPLEHVLGSPWNIHDALFKQLVRPLQAQVKARKLWPVILVRSWAGRDTARYAWP